MDKSELCRVCADFSDQTNPLFEGNLQKLLSKIKDITGLQLKNLKDLPENICKTCEKQILQAHKFRNRCIRAQKRLETLCDDDQNDKDQTKSKKKRKSQDNQVIKQEAPPIEAVIIFNEKHAFKAERSEDDEMLPKPEPTNSTDNNSNDGGGFNSPTNDNTTRNEEDVLAIEPEIGLTDNDNPLPPPSNRNELKSLKEPLKSCERTTQKRVERTYVCDQCGQHFTVQPYFKMHMLRHSGVKPYACKVCPKAYYASKGLKHHMLSHTGEKPFPCKYCERRFKSQSHLILHTRSEHTNERPFVCDQCPKSFISNNNFKAHMATHSDARDFPCKLCNVSYKRPNHRYRHYNSVMHKENLKKQKPECDINQDC